MEVGSSLNLECNKMCKHVLSWSLIRPTKKAKNVESGWYGTFFTELGGRTGNCEEGVWCDRNTEIESF